MYCHKCGKPLVDNAVYCSYCGVKTKKPSMYKMEDTIESDVREGNDNAVINKENIKIRDNDSNKVLEQNGSIGNKVGHGIAYIGSFMLILVGGAIGKQMARQPDFIRFVSYAMPGAIIGFILAIITVVAGRKFNWLNYKKSTEYAIVSVIVLVGVIGGIYWAVGAFVVVNAMGVLYKKLR